MNTKRKLMFSFIGLILSIAVFSTVVFAWFGISDNTADFIIETGNLEAEANFYYASPETSEWVLVDSAADASRIFMNIVPGQVLTFKLVLTNKADSTMNADYAISFDKFLHDASSSKEGTEYADFKTADLTEVTTDTVALDNILSAVYFVCAKQETTNVSVTAAKLVDIYNKDGENKFSHISTSKSLASCLQSKSIDTGTIAKNTSVEYVLRFYFDPTVGQDTLPGNSNYYMNQAFSISSILVSFTQKQEVIE